MREEALKISPFDFGSEKQTSHIWDVDYKSTSDEEDNDSDEE